MDCLIYAIVSRLESWKLSGELGKVRRDMDPGSYRPMSCFSRIAHVKIMYILLWKSHFLQGPSPKEQNKIIEMKAKSLFQRQIFPYVYLVLPSVSIHSNSTNIPLLSFFV